MDKFLCIDLGTTTLGIARSDSLGIAHPLEEYRFPVGYYKKAREHVINLCKENNIFKLIIGLPLQIDRQEGKRCESSRRFADDLKKECEEIEIILFDESYSTIEAHDRLMEQGYKEKEIKEVIDMYSAVVILEDYLRNNYGK